MQIVVLVAGTNEPSNADTLAESFIRGMKKVKDVEVVKFRLKDLTVKHFTVERYIKACLRDDDFCRIQDAVEASSGMVIATPIWNFSVPAHLKNVIDRMGAFALDEETHSKGLLRGKPFFFIYTGGAPVVAWKALMSITLTHVSEAMKYYGGTVVGKHFEAKCMMSKGKFGLIVHNRPKSLARMEQEGEKFAQVASHFQKTGRLPWRKQLAHSFFTWAYRIGNRIMYPVTAKQ